MVTKESNVITLVGRARKGKTSVVEEEKQVCIFVFHISQDSITGNGRKNQAFWERIVMHCNNNCLPSCGKHPARSLETKWGFIKHDVAKFCGNYHIVVALNESGTFSEDKLQKVFELFKSKASKTECLCFHTLLVNPQRCA
jgi:hypothetical protein